MFAILWRFRPRRPYKSWWKYVQWRVETFTGFWAKDVTFITVVNLAKDKTMRRRVMTYLRWCKERKR